VESKIGVGSKFTVKIPIRACVNYGNSSFFNESIESKISFRGDDFSDRDDDSRGS
jgi:hypothetical protein